MKSAILKVAFNLVKANIDDKMILKVTSITENELEQIKKGYAIW